MFTEEQTKQLTAPLDKQYVSQRDKGGVKLSYIEGWHAIAEANRIFGFGCWDREAVDIHQLGETTKNAKGNAVVSYMARVRITVRCNNGDIVVREGCGYGSGFAGSEGDAHESAIKEAETDAMKRALMTFGNAFGLALYDKTQANVKDMSKPQWNGPLDRVALKNAASEFNKLLGVCQTVDQVDILIHERSAVLDQIKIDLPQWWRWEAEKKGLDYYIENKREELKAKAA